MPVTVKSAREIELMRAAGKILGKVHQDLGKSLINFARAIYSKPVYSFLTHLGLGKIFHHLEWKPDWPKPS